jgi:chromosome segregation ATPase
MLTQTQAHLHPQPHLTLPPDDLALFASSLVRQLSDALEGASQARSDAQVEADEAQATLARERLERQEHESACSKEIGELTAEIDLSRRRISELQSQLAAQA